MQFLIRERMRGMPEPTSIKSRGALLLELARELRELKEELEERRYGKSISAQEKQLIHSLNHLISRRKRARATETRSFPNSTAS